MNTKRALAVIRPTKENMKTPQGVQYLVVSTKPLVLLEPDFSFKYVPSMEEMGPMEQVKNREEWLFRPVLTNAIADRAWDWKINDFIRYNTPFVAEAKPEPEEEVVEEKPAPRRGRPKGWRPGMGTYDDFLKRGGK